MTVPSYDDKQARAELRPCVICRRLWWWTDPQATVCQECQR